jgi:hypothetical protein
MNAAWTGGRLRARSPACNLTGMSEFTDLESRLDQLSAQAAEAQPDDGLLAEMESILSEGYARALAGDARRRRLVNRLAELAHRIDAASAAAEANTAAVTLSTLDDTLQSLRGRLDRFRADWLALSASR